MAGFKNVDVNLTPDGRVRFTPRSEIEPGRVALSAASLKAQLLTPYALIGFGAACVPRHLARAHELRSLARG